MPRKETLFVPRQDSEAAVVMSSSQKRVEQEEDFV
jgi:hypothetical protein